MTHSQESRVSSSQDTFRVTDKDSISSSVSALVNKLSSCSTIGADGSDDNDKSDMAASNNHDNRKMEEVFPWLTDFWESCHTSVGTKNIKVLENLVLEYLGKVSSSVKDCYMKPNRAAKLKKSMNDVLVFFHLCYQDMQESMEHSSYLDRMTDLVSMYMDMEIKASRRRKESVKKIAYRLCSCLYTLLDNSEEHMLDAILKAKFINKHHRELCVPLLGKILNRTHTYTMYETLYVRYLLVFKIWKKVVANAEERRRINKLAVTKLIPPPHFVEKSKLFNTVLPKIPKSKKSVTMFFMQAKFNLKNACTAFLKTCRESQQPGFTHNLAINIDKPLFFSDGRSNSPTGLDEKEIGGGSGNLINDIWSSICNDGSTLENTTRLKDLTSEKCNTEQVVGKKKVKEKTVKKKLKKKKVTKTGLDKGLFEKNKKKKLKKKAVAGPENKTSLNGKVSTDLALLKKLCKGDKITKKKKKKLLEGESKGLPPLSTTGASVPILSRKMFEKDMSKETVEVKLENPILPVVNGDGIQKEGYESKQLADKELSSSVTCDLSSVDQKHVLVKKDNRVQINEPLNQVDLVNSASSNENSVIPLPKEISQSSTERESPVVDQVHVVNSAASDVVTESQHRVIVKIVEVPEPVQPSSTCSPPAADVPVSSIAVDVSVNTSQSRPVSAENEALATKSTEATSTDAVAPRTIRDPVLVSSQSTSSQVPDTVSYACDSSIKHEVPLSGDEDCAAGVNRFNGVTIDIVDSDVQILAELRQRGAVKCDGDVDEVTLTEDFIRRENVEHLNLFHTGNDALVIQLLDDLPDDNIPLTAVRGDENSDSPPPESFDTLDTTDSYLTNLINYFSNPKDEDVNGKECLLREILGSEGYDVRLGEIRTTEETTKNLMEGDEASTDEEVENSYNIVAATCAESSTIIKRQCPISGKVIPTAVISSTGNAQSPATERGVSEVHVSNRMENSFNPNLTPDNAYPSGGSETHESDSVRESPSHPHINTVNSSVLSSVTTAENARDISAEAPVSGFVPAFDSSRSENSADRTQGREEARGVVESSSKKVVSKSLGNSVSVKQSIQEQQYSRLTVTLPRYNPDSVECIPNVVSDVRKSSEQPLKELPKSTQGGMFLESNSSCGKFTRVPYTAMPVSGAMYPYPYPSQVHVGNFIPTFAVGPPPPPNTCNLCLSQYIRVGNYNQGATCYHEGHLPYSSSEADREAEKDQEILRKIEESLTADRSVKCEEPSEEYESKSKTDIDSCLPLKKRLTLARVQMETKVKEEEEDGSKKLDGFPSYPRKPMMSIAELEKVHNFAELVKYRPNEAYFPLDGYQMFTADYSGEETVIEIPDKKPSHELMQQYTRGMISTPVVDHTSHRNIPPHNYSAVIDNCKDPRFAPFYHSTCIPSGVSVNATQGNPRPLKTLAERKEIPAHNGPYSNYSGMKMDHHRNTVSLEQRNIEQTNDPGRNVYRVPKHESFIASGQACSAVRHHIVNVSVDNSRSHNETRSHKSSRRKKSRLSDNRPRNASKRSRSRTQSVIQNADTVDEFMKSFETKRRRKHVSR